jgi:hypothetical protein
MHVTLPVSSVLILSLHAFNTANPLLVSGSASWVAPRNNSFKRIWTNLQIETPRRVIGSAHLLSVIIRYVRLIPTDNVNHPADWL